MVATLANATAPEQPDRSGRLRQFFLPRGTQLWRNDPRQQLVDAVDRVICDALQDVAQVQLRVDPAQLGRAEQRVDHGGTLTANVRAQVQVVLALMRSFA